MKQLYTAIFFLLLATAVGAQKSASITFLGIDHTETTAQYHGGITANVSFNVGGMKGKRGDCVLFFYKSDGSKLMDTNGDYRATDGQVCVSAEYQCPYDGTQFNNYKLYLPHSELHSRGGSLMCRVMIRDEAGVTLVESQPFRFTYIHTETPCILCGQTGRCGVCMGQGGRFSPYGYMPCGNCGGRGVCSYCHGNGRIITGKSYAINDIQQSNTPAYHEPYDHTCSKCGGTGTCMNCGGNGWIITATGNMLTCTYCNGDGKCFYCKGRGHR